MTSILYCPYTVVVRRHSSRSRKCPGGHASKPSPPVLAPNKNNGPPKSLEACQHRLFLKEQVYITEAKGHGPRMLQLNRLTARCWLVLAQLDLAAFIRRVHGEVGIAIDPGFDEQLIRGAADSLRVADVKSDPIVSSGHAGVEAASAVRLVRDDFTWNFRSRDLFTCG